MCNKVFFKDLNLAIDLAQVKQEKTSGMMNKLTNNEPERPTHLNDLDLELNIRRHETLETHPPWIMGLYVRSRKNKKQYLFFPRPTVHKETIDK